MFKNGKKLVSKLLMLIMCTSLLTTTIAFSGGTNVVYASENAASTESDFIFDANLGKITGYEGYGGEVAIPSTINGVKVKIIGYEAFRWCDSLTSIVIPDGVTTIEDGAFYGCSNITSITIPNSATTIEASAFDECSSLTSISIPNGVKSIAGDTFDGCVSLKSITIPNSVTSIGDNAFDECSSLVSITIPNSVTSIGDSAFGECTSLTSITIPNSITSIEDSTFYGCSNLTSVTIPSSVTNIGNFAFTNDNTSFYVESEKTKELLINYGIDKSKIILSNKSSIVSVKSVILNNKNLSLVKGKTSILTAKVAPTTATNKAVTWKSSDTLVATVDSNGKVTGVAAGSATITCTASDGSSKTAICKVTVTNPVSVTSVKLNKRSLNLVKGKTAILKASVSPKTAANKTVTWKSSDTSVATVDSNGKVTAVAKGSAEITCTASDGSGKYAACSVTVTK